MEREILEVDVLYVGGGPSSLASAIHLSNLIKKHNESSPDKNLGEINIMVIEKGAEIGSHSISGAVLIPNSLKELFKDDFETKFNELEKTPVTNDSVLFLTKNGNIKSPITPPFFKNHGNYIISLGKLTKWLGSIAEGNGVNVYAGFPGKELLFENNKVIGVRTNDQGLDKNGKEKSNFTAGVDIKAKITILGDGSRGNLTKQLVNKLGGEKNINPQVYAVGVKELWEIPERKGSAGTVIHTMGYPLKSDTYGGGFIYFLSDTVVIIGFVVGLDYKDPTLDPHNEFNKFKLHPFVSSILKDGKVLCYGAKTLPEGGFYSMPKLYTDGCMVIGDAGAFLNPLKLKGIHLAIKSGMLSAETAFSALLANDFSEKQLSNYEKLFNESWAKKELYSVRNTHQGFDKGRMMGMFHIGLQFLTGGRGLIDPMKTHAGHTRMKKISKEQREKGKEKVKPDGKLTFDKLTDVYYSGTKHEEDQPCHLVVSDIANICNVKCKEEYGNPCQHFCPANVYEMISDTEGGETHIKFNFTNCVHCKTCDIMDPYQIITWTTPEGGGGPGYAGM